jgi:hypothetical protein
MTKEMTKDTFENAARTMLWAYGWRSFSKGEGHLVGQPGGHHTMFDGPKPSVGDVIRVAGERIRVSAVEFDRGWRVLIEEDGGTAADAVALGRLRKRVDAALAVVDEGSEYAQGGSASDAVQDMVAALEGDD